MDIVSATRAGGFIRRQSWHKGLGALLPTDTADCFQIYRDGKQIGKRWNPSREDILAGDWEVNRGETMAKRVKTALIALGFLTGLAAAVMLGAK